MKLTILIILATTISSFAQDSTVVLPKKTALWYYQEHLRAEYLAQRTFIIQMKVDTLQGIIREKNTQLDTYKAELGGKSLQLNAMAERKSAAEKGAEILQIRLRVTRRQRNVFIISTGLTASALGYVVWYQATH